MLSEDADAPYDRPNLSKDYLAGGAKEDWMPLRSQSFYADNGIDLRLQTKVESIDLAGRRVVTSKGEAFGFERLLIATGAEPVRPPIAGIDQSDAFTLRSFEDSRVIIERAQRAKSAVVLGSGFIGLETAAALSERGLDVHVVSKAARPLDRVLGRELGDLVRTVHEGHGEVFHMNTSIDLIGKKSVKLADGTEITADLVIIGTGVQPRTALAVAAGLAVEQGILVNECLETGIQGIFAAGDVARWPYSSGETARVEHWVVAERQGQVVAENMLGAETPYREAPFFWSVHHDVTIRYAGHAATWDEIVIDGSVADHDCMVSYRKKGQTLAVATIGRNFAALEQAELLSGLTAGG